MPWYWPFKRGSGGNPTPSQASRKTRDLSPGALEKSADRQDLFALVELFLVRRIQTELELEEKRAEVKLKTAEAEAQTKLKLAELHEQRRALRAAKQAERNRTLPRDAKGRVAPARYGQLGCAVCADPGSPNLTVEQIRLHHEQGHSNGGLPH